jgi:hypothetical protein
MRSAKSTKLKRNILKTILPVSVLLSSATLWAQNSPYSRFGLGDVSPNTNVSYRGMGGVSAGFADFLSVNFNNPASYSNFLVVQEVNSKKIQQGRMLLDVGINIENRTLTGKDNPIKFSNTDPYFSYVQIGIPIRKGWGLSFGLRPVTRINYKINRYERLKDPITGNNIDSSFTEFSGTGGSYLPSIGTGVAIGNFSVGANIGYLFGKREASTRRTLLNDTVAYYASNHTTNTSFGGVFFNAGVQYNIPLSKPADKKQTNLRLGVAGNWQQSVNASRDIIRETFTRDATYGDARVDSVYEKLNDEGTVIYPASYTFGFAIDHADETGRGWRVGADFVQTKWSNYRFFGQQDSVQNSWQVRVGGQFQPRPQQNYFSRVAYRAGFSFGPDYIRVKQNLPQYTASFGMGLPIANNNRLSPGQFTIVNLGFEYMHRGNDNNLLKENTFRVSIGLNLSDIWFNKRKYD